MHHLLMMIMFLKSLFDLSRDDTTSQDMRQSFPLLASSIDSPVSSGIFNALFLIRMQDYKKGRLCESSSLRNSSSLFRANFL